MQLLLLGHPLHALALITSVKFEAPVVPLSLGYFFEERSATSVSPQLRRTFNSCTSYLLRELARVNFEKCLPARSYNSRVPSRGSLLVLRSRCKSARGETPCVNIDSDGSGHCQSRFLRGQRNARVHRESSGTPVGSAVVDQLNVFFQSPAAFLRTSSSSCRLRGTHTRADQQV